MKEQKKIMKKFETTNMEKTVYNMKFFGMKDLYDYLKSNPQVNVKVFSKQYSIENNFSFAGAPLDVAIEYLLKGYTEGLDNFLKANQSLKSGTTNYVEDYEVKRSMYSGIPVAPLVSANIPDCRLITEATHDIEVKNIYFNLSYPSIIKEAKIRNRGLATLYMIQALEERGVMVNFRAFDLSKFGDEIFHFSIDLKKPGEEKLNIQKCYYPLIAREFSRRIIFRVEESSDVTHYGWGSDYGKNLPEEECRVFYKAKKNDIFITSPLDLGINGDNIYEDTLNMIESLNLEKEFDVKLLKKLSRE